MISPDSIDPWFAALLGFAATVTYLVLTIRGVPHD